jgi:hypothetical protein
VQAQVEEMYFIFNLEYMCVTLSVPGMLHHFREPPYKSRDEALCSRRGGRASS